MIIAFESAINYCKPVGVHLFCDIMDNRPYNSCKIEGNLSDNL